MEQSLKLVYLNLLNGVTTQKYRYLFPTITLNERMRGIVGPRGTGKTTMMLQYLRDTQEKENSFYVSADNIYFSTHTLFDFVMNLYVNDGIQILFIDEIHKYKNWNQELKNIYDSFPDLHILFSGSSSLDLIQGHYDLSRRAVLSYLHGMSFREYLSFSGIADVEPLSFEDIIKQTAAVSERLAVIPSLLTHFREYLHKGYYPFVFESSESYNEKLLSIVEKTIYSDISHFFSLKTSNLHIFKKILLFVATSNPGKINTHNLSQSLKIDDKTTTHYLSILQKTGLIRILYGDRGGHVMLRKPEKIYLSNTSLYFVLAEGVGQDYEIGAIRELFFLSQVENAGMKVFSSNKSDFSVDGYTFEIGGKSKKQKQIKDIKDSFVVKDDLLLGDSRNIPLHLFGFLY